MPELELHIILQPLLSSFIFLLSLCLLSRLPLLAAAVCSAVICRCVRVVCHLCAAALHAACGWVAYFTSHTFHKKYQIFHKKRNIFHMSRISHVAYFTKNVTYFTTRLGAYFTAHTLRLGASQHTHFLKTIKSDELMKWRSDVSRPNATCRSSTLVRARL